MPPEAVVPGDGKAGAPVLIAMVLHREVLGFAVIVPPVLLDLPRFPALGAFAVLAVRPVAEAAFRVVRGIEAEPRRRADQVERQETADGDPAEDVVEVPVDVGEPAELRGVSGV